MSGWKRYIAPVAVVCFIPVSGYATQYMTVEESQKICFPEADTFQSNHVLFTQEQIKSIEGKSGLKVHAKGQQIWKAIKNGETIGYFFADYVLGKHLLIDYSVAIDMSGKVKRVEILEYRESYGDEVKNESWLEQFHGKSSADEVTLNRDVMNIGGATLSSRHVTEGVKRIIATYEVITHPL